MTPTIRRTVPLLVAILPFVSLAVEDFEERPAAALCEWKVFEQGTPDIAQACLVFDGADYLEVGNHFGCLPIAENQVLPMSTAVAYGGGDLVIRAVVLNTGGTISEPSPNKVTCLDIPKAPELIRLGPG